MKHKLFRFAVIASLLSPFPPAIANASAQDVHEIADICMYSQRLLKDYALIGMEVTYHDPAADLVKNIKIVNQYLEDLKSHHLGKGLNEELLNIEKEWRKIEPTLQKQPDKTKMSELHQLVETFTEHCEVLADKIAEDTGIEGEHYVVLIAELGMESQRLAALYMMKAWGVADPNYYEQVETILHDYEKITQEIKDADDKLVSLEIKNKLKTIDKKFLVFKFMAASKSGRFVPTRAEKTASKIFKEIREILKLEEKLVE